MLKRLFSPKLLLVCLVMFLAIPVSGLAATEVTIHYQQDKGDTATYNVWIWPDGGDGQDYTWSGEDDFGKVLTMSTSAETIGFIVHGPEGDWAYKDGSSWGGGDVDRYVTAVNGKIEIWLKQEDKNIYSSPNGDIYGADSGAEAPAAAGDAPQMPKTGMGGTSKSDASTYVIWSLIGAAILSSVYFIRRKQVQ